jgi:hypothetical protein
MCMSVNTLQPKAGWDKGFVVKSKGEGVTEELEDEVTITPQAH